MNFQKRIVEGAQTELTKGEAIVLDILNRDLPIDWEIYVQPHLNGRRPDFVLLNPNVGIAVLEVKDWENFDRFERALHDVGPYRSSSLSTGLKIKPIDPATQLLAYKKDIFEIYCPRLEQKSGLAAINAGLIFPFADEAAAINRFDHAFRSSYDYVLGKQSIAAANIHKIVPASAYTRSKIMTPEHADDLRSWLIEPDHERAKREPLKLDAQQREYAATRTATGYRRIRGPAGSGKTLVVASRAARLSAEGKKVLVVAFNITLISYLRDLAARAGVGSINDITWINFHELCRHLCEDLGLMEEYFELAEKFQGKNAEPFFHEVPNMIRAYLDDIPSSGHEAIGLPQYDAILVDEGQDFTLDWWKLLRHLHREGGEMLLVADTTQDLYDTAQVWTEDEMPGSGFAGRWATLDVSYRLPAAMATLADEFSLRFVSSAKRVKTEVPTGELAIEPCTLRWTQCQAADPESLCVEAAMQLIANSDDKRAAVTDLTILVETKAFGRDVQEKLEANGIRTLATFNPHDRNDHTARSEERRRKLAFQSNRPFVKISTIHSFKGWEARLLVMHVARAYSDDGPSPKSCAAIYAALTRLKRDPRGSALSVICEEPIFAEYGSMWPDYVVA